MENISWVVTLLIGAIISIPVGIFVNLISPSLQNWLSRSSTKVRGVNIARLEWEIKKFEGYKNDRQRIFFDIVFNIIIILTSSFLGMLSESLGFLLYVVAGDKVRYDDLGFSFVLCCLIIGMMAFTACFALSVDYLFILQKYKDIDKYIDSLQKRIAQLKNP